MVIAMALIAATPADNPHQEGGEDDDYTQDHIAACTIGNRLFRTSSTTLGYYARSYCYTGSIESIDIDITVYRIYTAGGMDIQSPVFYDSKTCYEYDCTINNETGSLLTNSTYALESIHTVVEENGDTFSDDAWNCCTDL